LNLIELRNFKEVSVYNFSLDRGNWFADFYSVHISIFSKVQEHVA